MERSVALRDDRTAAPEPPPDTGNAAVTAGELAALLLATGVGVLALASFVAATLGVHGLGTVLGFTALGALVLAVLARRGLPPVTADLVGILVAAGSAAVAAVMYLPGFRYAVADKDPGVYVVHAFAIARGGSVSFTDPLLAAGDLPVVVGPGARFRGLWIADAVTGDTFPQFYHLWPSLLATSYDAGGYGLLVATTPLLGVLCVVLTVLIARRIAGPVAAGVAGLLMATNMMQVWQAKYPTTEILSQLLFLGALLGVLLAIRTRWRWAALVAGVLTGIGYLCRADGLLLVLLCVAALAALWVLRRFDARAGWFAAGLGVLMPLALWQAYGAAGKYTAANDVPGLWTVLAAIGVCVVGAALLRRPLAGVGARLDARVAEPRTQRRAGLVATGFVVALFCLGVGRPVFGPDYTEYGGQLIRSYDEINLHRLSWFFSWPGLLLVVAGVAFVALRRWSAPGWLVVVPTVGLLTLYAWHARNSPYFMWVGRRFVPTVLPGMVLLIALAVAGIFAWRWRDRFRAGVPVALLLTAFLAAVQLNQSVPLRGHDEWRGSYEVTRSVAALAGGERGIFLWQQGPCCQSPALLFAPSVWLIGDQDSAMLPAAGRVPAYVKAYADTFPDRPLFVVYPGRATPPAMPGLSTTAVARFAGTMPHWQESSIARPGIAEQVPYDVTIYRVAPVS